MAESMTLAKHPTSGGAAAGDCIREPLVVTVGSQSYRGERVILGGGSLRQTILYRGRCFEDRKRYEPAVRDGLMRTVAAIILERMVAGE